MDANTKDVLMAIIALISAIVTPLILLYVTKKQNEKIDSNQVALTTNQQQITAKVDEYHKEVNGNMAKLLKTTEELATANEKARHQSEGSGLPDDAKLKITGGEIKITGEAKKK